MDDARTQNMSLPVAARHVARIIDNYPAVTDERVTEMVKEFRKYPNWCGDLLVERLIHWCKFFPVVAEVRVAWRDVRSSVPIDLPLPSGTPITAERIKAYWDQHPDSPMHPDRRTERAEARETPTAPPSTELATPGEDDFDEKGRVKSA